MDLKEILSMVLFTKLLTAEHINQYGFRILSMVLFTKLLTDYATLAKAFGF